MVAMVVMMAVVAMGAAAAAVMEAAAVVGAIDQHRSPDRCKPCTFL